MPSGIVKAIVLVEDLDATLAFVEGVADAKPVIRFDAPAEQTASGLGWPEGKGATRGAIVGARAGILEFVEIPPALRDVLKPGVAGLSFGSRDVAAGVEAARAAGFDPGDPFDIVGVDGATSSIARIDVGGVPFELINFGVPPK